MPNWTKDEYGQKLREGRVTLSTPAVQARDPVQGAKLECVVQNEPLAEVPRKEAVPEAVHVRITVRSQRIRDIDNVTGGAKYILDCLRYCGAIRDDAPECISLEVRQEKTKVAETLIEVFNKRP